MKFGVLLLNAMKFFLLLRLLFWSLTWNIPQDIDLSTQNSIRNEAELKDVKNDLCFLKDKDSDMQEICNQSREPGKPAESSDKLIPSFNDWRKKELEEYEKNHAKQSVVHQRRKFIRRKLNYASSKCGAKILSSNPGSRNRMAVLSEKSDEYFLNPCRFTTWFVVELCDAVEVTEVEVANYELYSSSPKEFSVFWSDVFPTLMWHHLGTFMAEDKRTMQTFNVEAKNMGKFIKVVIHSHHGKEHYCPLSVIRVLGYSMVQTLEDIEDNKENINSDFGLETDVKTVVTLPEERESIFEDNRRYEFMNNFITKSYERSFCRQLFTHCTNTSKSRINHTYVQNSICRFLHEIMTFSDAQCLDVSCPQYPRLFVMGFNSISLIRLNINSSNVILLQQKKPVNNFNDRLETKDIIKDYEYKKSLRMRKEKEILSSNKPIGLSEKSNDKEESHCAAMRIDKVKNNPNELNSITSKCVNGKITRISDNMCRYDRHEKENEIVVSQRREYGEEIDSAGLINKESVLYKLATKIKGSEIDLSLINKYLQKLSESYRQHIEEMKIKFQKTFQEMTKTSEEARIFNEKQEQHISVLKTKIEALNETIESLVAGKKDLIKRVFGLHGFILILEIVVIATVFNLFMNVFKKKNVLYQNRSVIKKH